MSLADFLFNGATPSPSPTGSDTSSSFPIWLQQALANSLGAAGQLASQPFAQFPGPTVASPSDLTTRAQGLAASNVGNYQPFLDKAGALTTAAGGTPWGNLDVSQYLNPFQDYVTGALNRNLQEQVLPSIQDKFVSAGQSRSPQEQEITMRAARDTQTAIGQSLAGGYGGALNAALAREQAQHDAQLNSGKQFGTLGLQASQLGAVDVGQLAAAGAGKDANAQTNINAALSQFQQEQQWPYAQLGYFSDILHGLPASLVNHTTQQVNAEQPQSYGPSGIGSFLGGASLANSLGFRRGGRVPMPRGALNHYRLAA